MKMILQKSITGLIIGFSFFLYFGYASADNGTWTFASSSGLQTTAENIGYSSQPATPEMIISQSIKMILAFLGIIFLGLIIYGGILWMTAAGNEPTVDKAKKIIEEATIGLVIVIAAYAVTFFVINYFGPNTLN
jgi:hypothetical protein